MTLPTDIQTKYFIFAHNKTTYLFEERIIIPSLDKEVIVTRWHVEYKDTTWKFSEHQAAANFYFWVSNHKPTVIQALRYSKSTKEFVTL